MEFPVRGKMITFKQETGERVMEVDLTILNSNVLPLGPLKLEKDERMEIWVDGELSESLTWDDFNSQAEDVAEEDLEDLQAVAEEFGGNIRLPEKKDFDNE